MEHTVDDNGNTGNNDHADDDDQVPLFDLISSFLGPLSPSPSKELEDDQHHDAYDTYDMYDDRIDDRIDDDSANEFGKKLMEIDDESININTKDVPVVSHLAHLEVDPCKVIIFSKD